MSSGVKDRIAAGKASSPDFTQLQFWIISPKDRQIFVLIFYITPVLLKI